jgi:hypothetical protein
VVTLPKSTDKALCLYQFQSLSRDSWWSHPEGPPCWVQSCGFQSLSRDSWWSHQLMRAIPIEDMPFQSLSRDSWWSHQNSGSYTSITPLVSIPQSGFLVVTPGGSELLQPTHLGFNPSVGILGGHTRRAWTYRRLTMPFQSLSRDSWWSHY